MTNQQIASDLIQMARTTVKRRRGQSTADHLGSALYAWEKEHGELPFQRFDGIVELARTQILATL